MNSVTASPDRLPHPGLPALSDIQLRGLVREFPVAWILFGSMVVGAPLLALFTDLAIFADPAGNMQQTARLATTMASLQGITVLVALFWPDAVWRNLPPGGRRVVDALPVSRRSYRLARVAAGFTLPLLMFLSLMASHAILRFRLEAFGEPELLRASNAELLIGSGAGASVLLLLSLVVAYLFGSAIALWGGRVIVTTLLLGAAYAFVPIPVLLALGQDPAANWYAETMVQGSWSPVRVLLAGLPRGSVQLAPVLGWMVALAGLCHYLAGRHDTR